MKQIKAYVFQIKPNGQQVKQMTQFAGCARKVWNLALAKQQAGYAAGSKFTSYFSMGKWLIDWKHELPFLKQAPSQSLVCALQNLEQAYKRFFNKTSDFPKFKKKSASKDSFRFPQGFNLEQQNNRIKLPKLGWIKYINSRTIEGTPKNVTVSSKSGKWFISIQTEREVEQAVHPSTSIVGIDLGITRFATLSDGTFIEPINSLKTNLAKLAKYQRRMARKQRGGSNWKKAKAKVQKLHAKVAYIRNDFLHKVSSTLSKNHATIVIEDLKVSKMSQSNQTSLNRSILDQGWGEFRRQLEYKQSWLGGQVLAVPAYNTSRTCPACSYISAENRKTQSDFECVECGFTENADLVGAINILRAGHARLACQANEVVNSSATGTHRSELIRFGLDTVGILGL